MMMMIYKSTKLYLYNCEEPYQSLLGLVFPLVALFTLKFNAQTSGGDQHKTLSWPTRVTYMHLNVIKLEILKFFFVIAHFATLVSLTTKISVFQESLKIMLFLSF